MLGVEAHVRIRLQIYPGAIQSFALRQPGLSGCLPTAFCLLPTFLPRPVRSTIPPSRVIMERRVGGVKRDREE
jgi:hypothetical protein